MGSYWHLSDRKCPYCNEKLDEVIFAEYLEDYNAEDEWMGNHHTCEYCGKKFKINMEFIFEKIEEDITDVPHPICPMNMYFEGDEDKFDVSKCNYDVDRGCSEGCKKK